MRKLIILAAACIGFAAQAKEVVGPLWNCQLSAQVSGLGFALGVGGTNLEGTGDVRCTTVRGKTSSQKVKVKISSGGFGLKFPTNYENIYVASPVIVGLVSAEQLLGTYDSVGPQVELTLGTGNVGGGLEISLQKEGLSFKVTLSVGANSPSLGAMLNVAKQVIIEPLE